MIQIYGPDLDEVKSSKTMHSMTLTHKPTGIKVSGTGDHEYGLRARLMQELRDKIQVGLDEGKFTLSTATKFA